MIFDHQPFVVYVRVLIVIKSNMRAQLLCYSIAKFKTARKETIEIATLSVFWIRIVFTESKAFQNNRLYIVLAKFSTYFIGQVPLLITPILSITTPLMKSLCMILIGEFTIALWCVVKMQWLMAKT